MSEQETILADIKKAVLSIDDTADVLLFGSRARGDFNDESDWDILVLTNQDVNDDLRLAFIGILIPLEIKFGYAINIALKNRVDWKMQVHSDFFMNIHEDGIAL